MDKFLKELLAEVNSTYDKFDLDLIVKENERMATIEADLDVFVKDIVPADIEKHSGVISRQLKKAYEAFDIEAQKEAKRSYCTLKPFIFGHFSPLMPEKRSL